MQTMDIANENILEDIKVKLAENKLAQYEQKWLNHVITMEDIRFKNSMTIDLSKETYMSIRPVVFNRGYAKTS
jgi:hypothetical protein